MQLRPRPTAPYPGHNPIELSRKRPKSPSEYDQPATRRPRKRYASENIAYELAALSLRSTSAGVVAVLPESTMEDADSAVSNIELRQPSSRHTVIVNSLDASDDDASDEEGGIHPDHALPMEKRPGCKPRIPNHILRSPYPLNPVRALVLYHPPVWQTSSAETNDKEENDDEEEFESPRMPVIEKMYRPNSVDIEDGDVMEIELDDVVEDGFMDEDEDMDL
ncbi:hypothetical protein BC936DRAFT_145390 [Jimgerdemannia flammicorona]|uniref:Uncharacterized protein n=2 Tax=Jimgerdemannia flammicorona TaxID=994334 RepID=A0A433DLV0_9FUNG|nr:hypothetical protein BC936DRAFT_145390 [Jimgerdemannia flammicorona]RUS30674.1 hypothetical protein BC938DRAFT_479094 [Jimgerdemannia flammicorona]